MSSQLRKPEERVLCLLPFPGTSGELRHRLPMGRAGAEKIKHVHLDFAARERERVSKTVGKMTSC